jgi:hypothetical protein
MKQAGEEREIVVQIGKKEGDVARLLPAAGWKMR